MQQETRKERDKRRKKQLKALDAGLEAYYGSEKEKKDMQKLKKKRRP